MSDPTLFETGDDELLIAAYGRAGRTLDDLPYTASFERIFEAVGGEALDRAALFRRLHNLRKAGRLPRLGRSSERAPRVDAAHERVLADAVEREIGRLSLRDQLPYTDAFGRIVTRFNAEAGLALDPHAVWRVVARLAK